jgi:hypothetical protein
MWCCWISPGHNPASTQRRGRRAPNIGLRESLAPEAQVSIRLMATTWPSIRRRRCRVVLKSIAILSRACSPSNWGRITPQTWLCGLLQLA